MATADFKLTLHPSDKLEFTGPFEEGQSAKLKIENPEEERTAYKVKCSDNSLFKIRPVIGILDKDASAEITVTLLTLADGKPPKKSQSLFVYSVAAGDVKKGRKAWDEAKGEQARKKLPVAFKEEPPKEDSAEEPKADDDKKEEEEAKEEEKKEAKEEEEEEAAADAAEE